MNIRKEPALFLVVVALAAWIYSGQKAAMKGLSVKGQEKEYEAPAESTVVMADAGERPIGAKELFREPSESSPLPPRPLAFPALPALPVVLPPLAPGQEPGAYWQLRYDVPAIEQHTFSAVVESTTEDPNATGDGGGDAVSANLSDAELRRRFDRIYRRNDTQPSFVVILDPNKAQLVGQNLFTNPITFDLYSRRDGSLMRSRDSLEGKDVLRVELAETRENEIALRKLRLPDGPASLKDRKDLIVELLAWAREEPWIFREAEQLAETVIAITGNNEDGYRWKLRVLRAEGELGREWDFLQGLPGDVANSSFRFRSEGEILARLTLWDDAEARFRQAVQTTPTDARSHAALASYLLDRSRAAEALPHAELAKRHIGRVTDVDDRHACGAVLVRANLALGNLDAAERALTGVVSTNGDSDLAYLRGAVAYAKRDFATALTELQSAAKSSRPDAVFAVGCAQLALQQWDEAKHNLQTIADSAPLLRHRALSALALLYEITGHPAEAIAAAEEAQRVDPTDAYVLYTLGRQKRLAQSLDESVELQRAALAQRDDLIESLVETAAALWTKSQGGDVDTADLAARAARYADRVVKLDTGRGGNVGFLEWQGFLHFRMENLAAATRAFEAGAARDSDFCQIGLALINYRQKRTAEAREQLLTIANDPVKGDIRPFARALVDQIDDHAGKEQVRDTFEREDLGGLWPEPKKLAGTQVRIQGGRLAIAGSPRSNGESYARRQLANGGDFLSVELMFQTAATHQARFAGLRLALDDRGGRAAAGFRVELGIDRTQTDPRPYLFIEDGRPRDGEVNDPIILDLPGFDATGEQRVLVAVEPDESGRQLTLVLSWNGQEVHRTEALRTLRPSTRNRPLNIDLLVSGRSRFDATFDDFRLVRRKEK